MSHDASPCKRPKSSSPSFLPSIDVIIPCHNCSKTLKEAVDSALQQSYIGDITVILYDDGSTDCTREVMNNCKKELVEGTEGLEIRGMDETSSSSLSSSFKGKRYITIVNSFLEETAILSTSSSSSPSLPVPAPAPPPPFRSRGAGYARNRCVLSGFGQVLCFLDSDDVMMSNRVEMQVLALRDYHYVGVNGWEKVEEDGGYHYHHQQREQQQHRSNIRFEDIDDDDAIHRLIVGCTFYRDPEGSTAHYTSWANSLTTDRLYLEQFRELTLLQPTWCLTRKRFLTLGGYLQPKKEEKESLLRDDDDSNDSNINREREDSKIRIVEGKRGRGGLEFGCAIPKYSTTLKLWDEEESIEEMRLCEDLRFFHAHLSTPIPTTALAISKEASSSCLMTGDHHQSSLSFLPPLLHLVKSSSPLLMYRHTPNESQSSKTSHKQLLRLRLQAFEERILRSHEAGGLWEKGFAVWGAGRDGKDFVKHLSKDLRGKVLCMVDVDQKKIDAKFYHNPAMQIKIKVLPFQVLQPISKDIILENGGSDVALTTTTTTTTMTTTTKTKKTKGGKNEEEESNIDYTKLPVVVCVAMYRTDGKLEENVKSIGRREGVNLWHFF